MTGATTVLKPFPQESIKLDQFRTDVIEGLTAKRKKLLSKYFYDHRGDQLFQQIMAMPEYYLTKCELDIFQNRTADLASAICFRESPFDLIELGAGDAVKSSFLLKFLLDQEADFTYRPIDISGNILSELGERLAMQLPALKIDSLQGEYFEMLRQATGSNNRRKVVLFLGGNIGNMEIGEAGLFCRELRSHLNAGDMALIGFDLKKNPQQILDAYNDRAGITAAFNLNLLSRINRELGANMDTDNFSHYQNYDPETGACRSYLVSLVRQQVDIAGNRIVFEENELIDMEVSQKFSRQQIGELAIRSGFMQLREISDSKNWFIDALWMAGH
ncbi:L-histidine N(alpha)-methyltransferase [Pedobacter xixiisoli]|nr:L-histidine N(alpha)-methyltransferase [Pedobacter xixiisoli]